MKHGTKATAEKSKSDALGLRLGGRGISTYHLMGTCHFARKFCSHNSVNSGGLKGHNSVNRMKIWAMIPEIMRNTLKKTPIISLNV